LSASTPRKKKRLEVENAERAVVADDIPNDVSSVNDVTTDGSDNTADAVMSACVEVSDDDDDDEMAYDVDDNDDTFDDDDDDDDEAP